MWKAQMLSFKTFNEIFFEGGFTHVLSYMWMLVFLISAHILFAFVWKQHFSSYTQKSARYIQFYARGFYPKILFFLNLKLFFLNLIPILNFPSCLGFMLLMILVYIWEEYLKNKTCNLCFSV